MYWKLSADKALIVEDKSSGKFSRYSKPAAIASVIVGLNGSEPAEELRRVFTAASDMVEDKSWRDRLMHDAFLGPNAGAFPEDEDSLDDGCGGDSEEEGDIDIVDVNVNVSDEEEDDDVDMVDVDDAPMKESRDSKKNLLDKRKSVFVVSPSGDILWDAKIVEMAYEKNGDGDEQGDVVGVRVHYKKWSSRFDEWVNPARVVARDKRTLQMQHEKRYGAECMRVDLSSSGDVIMSDAEFLGKLKKDKIQAVTFLYAPNRRRGPEEVRDLSIALSVRDMNSSMEKMLANLRALLLVVESALSESCLKATAKSGNSTFALDAVDLWREKVERAGGARELMECVIALENALEVEWLCSETSKFIGFLPTHSKALSSSNLSQVAVRLYMLDQAIIYRGSGKKGKNYL